MTNQTIDTRERIVRAAAELLTRGGRQALSTRAVSAAAGVQAPTIYRQFGDMQGLLDAVARETLAGYVRQMATQERADDPIEELRRGWDLHVSFGLANPSAYVLIYGDPTVMTYAPAARDDLAILHGLVSRVAEAGRLQVSVPHAVRLLAAAGIGVTLSLIAIPIEERDPQLSAAMREAVFAAIIIAPISDGAANSAVSGASVPGRVSARAVALHAVLDEATGVLSLAEQHLLGEWLDRLAGADAPRMLDGQSARSNG